MRLTRYSDYALRTLMYLGLQQGRLCSIAEIASAYRISEHHLTKVVHQLGQIGAIETKQGRGGGLRLGHSPEQINIGSIVRQTETDFALVDCFADTGCVITGPCRLQSVLVEALAAFLAVLDRYTLADLLGSRSSDLTRLLSINTVNEQRELA